ncbi:hypothetical protein CFP65_6377 [Kitasatospora sp. MMS16-BH015]|uniref:alpha/beta fold hydrolase n=1 Tax=Kitasatospora sp. MMS16-BH015 TaxID=2018025 RepID=UPI000CA33B93|nr:hypothetical protein [Kitasatospora sp. MMS16-BH015]AUG81033.1 hypothetical protein CFP65_6377 [Kitasatospora sp. MMS16-BH015]
MEFRGGDGVGLAYREVGRGRPVVLVHGHMSRGLHWETPTGGDPQALLAAVPVPTLVLTGREESHNRTAKELAAAPAHGVHLEVPGDHFTAQESPEYRAALTEFLAGA